MHLTDYLKEDDIFTDFRAADKAAALGNLCRHAAERHGLCYDHILQVVLDREELGSTGLGGGVALPHGQTSDVEKPALTLALAPEGVDFDSLDGPPVRIYVLILTPLAADGREHLQLLA
ncbi:MAG: PTS sugar transporter subunit IIA, partial [Candidatus Adiutrix sp.]|nr:PTS sugar transporter subunit IIA [Candidatus Adiutrix sp.]